MACGVVGAGIAHVFMKRQIYISNRSVELIPASTLESIGNLSFNMATTREYTLEKIAGHHVEETLGQGALVDAKHASDEEHAQSLWQAIKANKKAVAWSVVVSMSVVMEGYDTILIGNFFGYPEFQKKYGQDYGGTAGYQISAPWQTGLGMGSTVGAIFGISSSRLLAAMND